jgi:hypothetical protein
MLWDCRLSTGLPPHQPTMSVVKPEGGPAWSMKLGQKSCVRSSGIITLSARQPSNGSGRSPPQTRPQWSITLGSPMKQDNANRRIPVSHKFPPGDWTRVPHDRKQTGDSLDQWNIVWMQWDCRLSTGLPPSIRLCRLWSEKKGGPAESVKPGLKSCVRSSGIITLLARRPSDGSGWSPPRTRPQWSITLGSPM